MIFGILPNINRCSLYSLVTLIEAIKETEKSVGLIKTPHKILFPKTFINEINDSKLHENTEKFAFYRAINLERNFIDFKAMIGLCDIFISVGGDGSFLHAVNLLKNKDAVIVGVNSGDLGFLNSIHLNKNDIKEKIERLLKAPEEGNYSLVSKTFLKANGHFINEISALNDIVISHSNPGKILRLKIYDHDKFIQKYACDGIIISTATGSTAYNFTNNGPVLLPNDKGIIINPICASSMQNYPIVIHPTEMKNISIKITYDKKENYDSDMDISYDGFTLDRRAYYLCSELNIETKEFPIRFVQFNDPEFDFLPNLPKRLIRHYSEIINDSN